ncbi:MAG: hypothetical protein FJW14_10960 [Acidimicrobiia bacterium]|nr:hypothetical protein [Acidimicrobiia bacterium]
MELLIAFGTAGLLTLFDLDRTFYVPTNARRKFALYVWWWGFVVANGIVSAVVYSAFGDRLPMEWHPYARAFAIGLAFLAIVRLKLATFRVGQQEVPFGIEAFYEEAKRAVFKRINRIAKEARYDETMDLANRLTLADLGQRTRLSIDQDSLLSPEEKLTAKTWLLQVVNDHNATEGDKRATLANYLLSGQR